MLEHLQVRGREGRRRDGGRRVGGCAEIGRREGEGERERPDIVWWNNTSPLGGTDGVLGHSGPPLCYSQCRVRCKADNS